MPKKTADEIMDDYCMSFPPAEKPRFDIRKWIRLIIKLVFAWPFVLMNWIYEGEELGQALGACFTVVWWFVASYLLFGLK